MASILRLPAVVARTGLPRSTIYQQMSDKQFPRPIKLGPRAVGWVEKDIDDWIDKKISQAKPGKPKLSDILVAMREK